MQTVSYVSRSCIDMDKKFYSFVGESAASFWGISQNILCLWGMYFYCMCNCKVVHKGVDFTGSIAMVQIWAQELLGYHSTLLHQIKNIMGDVDALT